MHVFTNLVTYARNHTSRYKVTVNFSFEELINSSVMNLKLFKSMCPKKLSKLKITITLHFLITLMITTDYLAVNVVNVKWITQVT